MPNPNENSNDLINFLNYFANLISTQSPELINELQSLAEGTHASFKLDTLHDQIQNLGKMDISKLGELNKISSSIQTNWVINKNGPLEAFFLFLNSTLSSIILPKLLKNMESKYNTKKEELDQKITTLTNENTDLKTQILELKTQLVSEKEKVLDLKTKQLSLAEGQTSTVAYYMPTTPKQFPK